MDDPKHSEEEIARARKLAGGPLGDHLAKYPLLSACCIALVRENDDQTRDLFSATATLLNLDAGPVAITCHHVLEKYRLMQQGCVRSDFHIGSLSVDPMQISICENPQLDLAVLSLDGLDLGEMLRDAPIGAACFAPAEWPPNPLDLPTSVCLGGYPGRYRRALDDADLLFGSFSVAATPVVAVHPGYFVVQFGRERWVASDWDPSAGPDLHDLGGMSGGPVFVERPLHFELVGIIKEFSQDYDLLYATRADLIRPDGSIERPKGA